MSDTFYKFVRLAGKLTFWMSAAPVVLGREHLPKAGACILASTHESPYDVALLIVNAPRLLDFVSIVEVFRNPLVGWFYGSLNAFPLDRSRPDSKTVRKLLDRLKRGRAVCMFPEGGLRPGPQSVIHTRRIRPGIGRIAALSGACIIPCVIINSGAYRRPLNWLPVFRTRYGVIFGEPMPPEADASATEEALVNQLVHLHATLQRALGESASRAASSAQ